MNSARRSSYNAIMRNLLMLAGIVLCPAPAHAQKDLECIDLGPGSAAAVVVADAVPLVHTRQHFHLGGGPMDEQLERYFAYLDEILKAADSDLARLVKLNFIVPNDDAAEAIRGALTRKFRGSHRPAVSFVQGKLWDARASFAVDAVAAGTRRPVWKAVGLDAPTDAGVNPRFTLLPPGTRIYVSGQAVPGMDLAEATRKTLEELEQTLKFLGLGKSAIVQLKAFYNPVEKGNVLSEEAEKFFGKGKVPPMVSVEWKSSLPVEIELIAWGGRERAGEPIEFLTPTGMKASPVYSRVARVNDGKLIFLSSFYGKANNNPEAEITDIFAQMERVLAKCGSDFRHLANATYYVTAPEVTKRMGELRPRYYDPKRPPAASLAMVQGTGRAGKTVTMDMIAVPSPRLKVNEYGPAEQALGEDDLKKGSITLYDGKTTFGWSKAEVVGSRLRGGLFSFPLGPGTLQAKARGDGRLRWGEKTAPPDAAGSSIVREAPEPRTIELVEMLAAESVRYTPSGLTPLFNGTDLNGWKAINHPKLPKERAPTWTVKDGILTTVGGPGCLEYDGKPFANFVLQLEVRTNLQHANGGVFFRAMPGAFMNGYEAQVYNRCHDSDVARPWTWATGAIDDRVNTRRLVSRDGEWFHYTIIAQGNHIATWVNGYPTAYFLDERKEHENPRLGKRTAAGTIQLQAHDAGTEAEFRNIRIAEWK